MKDSFEFRGTGPMMETSHTGYVSMASTVLSMSASMALRWDIAKAAETLQSLM
jgi:hypothetical protein